MKQIPSKANNLIEHQTHLDMRLIMHCFFDSKIWRFCDDAGPNLVLAGKPYIAALKSISGMGSNKDVRRGLPEVNNISVSLTYRLQDILDIEEIRGRDVGIKLLILDDLDPDDPFDNLIDLYYGTIEDVEWDWLEFNFAISDYSSKMHTNLPKNTVKSSNWANADQNAVGKPYPLIFGSLTNIPALYVDNSGFRYLVGEVPDGLSFNIVSAVYKDGTVVAASEYSISYSTFDGDGIQCVIIDFISDQGTSAITCDCIGIKDSSSGTYTGTASANITLPCDIIYFLLRHSTGLGLLTRRINKGSIGIARNKLSSLGYSYAGAIRDQVSSADIFNDLLFVMQGFMQIVTPAGFFTFDGTLKWNGKYKFRSSANISLYVDDGITPTTVMDIDDNMMEGKPLIKKRQLSLLKTHLTFNYDRNFGQDIYVSGVSGVVQEPFSYYARNFRANKSASNSKAVARYRKTVYDTFNTDWVTDATTANNIVTFWKNRLSNLGYEVQWAIGPKGYKLEAGDNILLTTVYGPGVDGWSDVTAEIVEIRPQVKQIGLTLWVKD